MKHIQLERQNLVASTYSRCYRTLSKDERLTWLRHALEYWSLSLKVLTPTTHPVSLAAGSGASPFRWNLDSNIVCDMRVYEDLCKAQCNIDPLLRSWQIAKLQRALIRYSSSENVTFGEAYFWRGGQSITIGHNSLYLASSRLISMLCHALVDFWSSIWLDDPSSQNTVTSVQTLRISSGINFLVMTFAWYQSYLELAQHLEVTCIQQVGLVATTISYHQTAAWAK